MIVMCFEMCPNNSRDVFPPQLGLKEQFSPLTCSAVYQIVLELPSFGDIGHRDFGLVSNITGLNGALFVVLTALKNTFGKPNSNVSFLKS